MVFKKGHIPWSKSQKGVCLNTGRTHFKKGHIPWCAGTKGIVKAWNKGLKGFMAGKKNSMWKGGKINNNGYIMILTPQHPFCDSQGYVRRSRLVIEKHLGRYLTPKEKVHHINGIKDDDRIENLKLFFNNSQHSKHHFPKGSKFGIHC